MRRKPMTLDDLKIDYIATTIGLIIALPILIARLIGSPLIADFGFEASFVYLPLTVLIILSLYQRQRSIQMSQNTP